jgi:hypothetical protein
MMSVSAPRTAKEDAKSVTVEAVKWRQHSTLKIQRGLTAWVLYLPSAPLHAGSCSRPPYLKNFSGPILKVNVYYL